MSKDRPDLKILIVDDFSSMRQIVRSLLEARGYSNLCEADNGHAALDMISEDNEIGLVVSDWSMPKMTGLELLKAIRSDPRKTHIPFLMVTAEAERERISEAIDAGVDNYIVKPFSGKVLAEKLSNIGIE